MITYFHPSFWYGNKVIMSDLFNRESLTAANASGIWSEGDPISLLVVCIIIRYIVFFFMVNTPVPSGVFAPAVVMGGLVGRALAGSLT